MLEKEIEDAIGQVETLYQSVTGRAVPDGGTEAPYAAIPVERDPELYVAEQLGRLDAALASVGGTQWLPPPWQPPLTVMETADDYRVWIDVPGVPRALISVGAAGGALIVCGLRPRLAAGEDAQGPSWGETWSGRFGRSVPLPADADPSKVNARLADGLLEVRIARRAAETTQMHPVDVAP